MPSSYPTSLDNIAINKTDITVMTGDHPTHHNDIADAVNKIEAELGTLPSRSYATVRARLDASWVDAKAVGATGDGATNDTAALQAAIAEVPASGGTLFVPTGVYLVDAASLTLKSNLRIVGAGMSASTIKLRNGANGRLISYEGAAIQDVFIENIGFDGNMVNQSDGANRDARSGLFLRQVHRAAILRCRLTNFRSGAAVRMYACDDMLIAGNDFTGNGMRVYTTGSHTLPQGTITISTAGGLPDTTGWASPSGKILVGTAQIVTYTGKTATTFTGCTGGTGTFAAGTVCVPVTNDANNFVLICDATFCGSSRRYRAIGNRYYSNTDTGTAMDGVVQSVVIGNHYESNGLGVGIGFSNTETGGTADCCEDIVVNGNVIIGPNYTSVESQGIKSAAFGNPGEGGGANNRALVISDNIIRLCDRALWIDDTDDSLIANNILKDKGGPNGHLLLLATSATDVNRLRVTNNRFKNTTNRGISFDAGTVTDITIEENEFHTDVVTAIGGTIPATAKIRNNRGYNPQGVISLTPPATGVAYTAGPTPEVLYVRGGTVTSITKNGRSIALLTNTSIPITIDLDPGEQVIFNYSGTMTIERDRR